MKNKIDNISCKLRKKLNSHAVSSIISVVLVLLIFFAAAGAVLYWGPNYIRSEEIKREIKSTADQFTSVSEVLKSLIENGNGSTFTDKITINSGSIEVDSEGEKLIFLYSNNPKWGFNVTGITANSFTVVGQTVDNATIYWLANGTCFLDGTKVAMADGSYKNIEDIKAGDIVRSYDEVTEQYTVACVKTLLVYGTDRMDDYYLVINDKVKVTPNHRFFVNNDWVEAGELKVGDALFDASGQKVSLFSMEKRFSKESSYDLILESGSAYFADGFLVKSDVEQGSVEVRKMSCAQRKLKPLGGPTNNPPNPPSNPNPINGATDVAVDADLSWTCSDPDGDPLTYDVYFGTSSNPPLVSSGQSATSYDPYDSENMEFSTIYYWKIVAHDNRGGSRTGSVWSFTTKSDTDTKGAVRSRPANTIVINALYSPKNISCDKDIYIDEFSGNGVNDYNLMLDRKDHEPNGWKRDRILIHFPTDSAHIEAGSHIQDAKMYLLYFDWLSYVDKPYHPDLGITQPAGWTIKLWRVTKYWDEGSTWTSPGPPGIWEYGYVNIGTAVIPQYAFPAGSNQWMMSSSLVNETQKYVNAEVVNNGWILTLTDEVVCTLCGLSPWRMVPFFVSGNDNKNPPVLKVWYVKLPVVSDSILSATNVGEITATFNGRLTDPGLQHAVSGTYTDCYFNIMTNSEPPAYETVSAGSQNTPGSFSTDVSDLYSGYLYSIRSYVENDAGSDESTSSSYFLTVPPPPTDLTATASTCILSTSWKKATCGVPASQVYTRVLAKKASQGWPSGPEDSSAILIYNGTGTSKNKALADNTQYNIRAWTYIWIDTPNGKLHKWSTQFANTTKTTGECGSDSPPDAYFFYGDLDGKGPGTLMYFNGILSSDEEGPITNYSWDFEDDGSWNAYGYNASYNHTNADSYPVRLRVRDNAGQYGYQTQTVRPDIPGDSPPTARFNYSDADGSGPGTLLNFDASWSSDEEGPITNYSWDFENDGSWNAYGVNVSYNHTNADSYPVRLRVMDNAGQYGYLPQTVQAQVSGDTPPTTPDNFEIIYNPTKLYNDTSYEFSVRSNDSQGDNIYYWFDWGDGNGNIDWWGPYPPNITISESGSTLLPNHKWDSSGIYEIKVRAVNDADGDPDTTPGLSSDWSNPIAIRIYYKYIVPPDKVGEPKKIPPYLIDGDNYYFDTVDMDLTGAVCIYLFNDNYPPIADPEDKGSVPFGAIWIFDLGSIVHTIPSASGEYKTILQNGGVMTASPGGAYAESCPIYVNGDILGFTVTMMRGDIITAGSGAKAYGISFKNLDTFTREQQEYTVYNIKTKYVGEYSIYWHDYLTRNYMFKQQSTPYSDFLVYDSGKGKQLIFSTALIKTNLQ